MKYRCWEEYNYDYEDGTDIEPVFDDPEYAAEDYCKELCREDFEWYESESITVVVQDEEGNRTRCEVFIDYEPVFRAVTLKEEK